MLLTDPYLVDLSREHSCVPSIAGGSCPEYLQYCYPRTCNDRSCAGSTDGGCEEYMAPMAAVDHSHDCNCLDLDDRAYLRGSRLVVSLCDSQRCIRRCRRRVFRI